MKFPFFSIFSWLNEDTTEADIQATKIAKDLSNGKNEGFFNTIGETGQELKESRANANKQETRILELMTEPCTPFEVHRLYCLKYPEVPITSIRRAMSNMSSKGLLEKTEQKKTEKYGKVNYLWKKVGG